MWDSPSFEKEVLINVSFRLNLGEKLGVVGATGSGKSTIVKLILRYYDPTRGKILIDGVDISQFNINSLDRS
jgi:ABC-type multidrug transport system fused ATPase/permease subunit